CSPLFPYTTLFRSDRLLGGDLVEGLRLWDRPGEAVEHVAPTVSVGLLEALGDDADHDVVGHEAALVHDLFRLQAEIGALPYGGPHVVARRDVLHQVVARDPGALGAIVGSLS